MPWLLILALLACSPTVAAEYLPLDQVAAGQRGVGKTVFSGEAIEEFEVEILGVLENVFPKQSLILARLSGGPLARTGVMAGMSGSPVYIDGKLAGAVAFSFPFSTEPLCGIRPIEDMLALMGDGCEFVSCTRYAHGGRRLGGSIIGGLLSRTANKLFHWIAVSVLTDCTTGIKMFRRDTFERLHLESRPVGWAVAFEMAIKAQILGLRLGEVPIISIDRLYGGKSTFRVGSWTAEYFRWFLWGARRLRKGHQSGAKVLVRIPAATALGGGG